jgi:ATP phosphoribosyltransferase regulatory subunit
MSETLSRIPKGFRYYAAAEASARRVIERTAMEVFEGWSYEEIVTPTVDYYPLFERGMGEDEARRSFRLTDADGQLLALRPDVTSSIARAAATLFAKRARPMRLCYCASVFHQEGQSRADWRRESRQIGCELFGRNSTAADMEILVVVMELLQRLKLDRAFVITITDIEIFNGIVENLSLDANSRNELRRLVDVRAVADLERFLRSYASPNEASAFANLIQLSGKGEIFGVARQVITNSRSCAALDRLEGLWRTVESLGFSECFEIDLGDVSHLNYYTGLIFKVYLEGLGGRLGSGGRYDKLTANFGKAEPAVGFVLEADALADLLTNRMAPESASQPEFIIANSETAEMSMLFRRAIERRAANKQVMIKSEV